MKLIFRLSSDSGKDLSRRLGLLSSASEDLNNWKESFSTENSICPQVQERREINDNDLNLKIKSIVTVAKRDKVDKLYSFIKNKHTKQ